MMRMAAVAYTRLHEETITRMSVWSQDRLVVAVRAQATAAMNMPLPAQQLGLTKVLATLASVCKTEWPKEFRTVTLNAL